MIKPLCTLALISLFAGVLASCSSAPSAPTGGDNSAAFVGLWTNVAADGSIAKVEIVKDGSVLHAHGYGQCSPLCDWKVADTSLADAADGNIVTTWTFDGGDFITTTLIPTGAHSASLHMNDHYSGVDHLSDHTMSRP